MELRRGRQVVLVAASATVQSLMMDLLMAIGILGHVMMRASSSSAAAATTVAATTTSTTGARAMRRQRTVIAVVTGSVGRHSRCRCGRCCRRIQ